MRTLWLFLLPVTVFAGTNLTMRVDKVETNPAPCCCDNHDPSPCVRVYWTLLTTPPVAALDIAGEHQFPQWATAAMRSNNLADYATSKANEFGIASVGRIVQVNEK